MNVRPQSRDTLHLELAAETLRQFSEVRFVARGTSMVPTLYPGDCLSVKLFGGVPPRRGDIVLCNRAGEFRVHRIVDILEESATPLYVLRGDALGDHDPPCPARELLGRVTSLLRCGKSFEPNSRTGVYCRALRAVVRRSKIVALLLLRWHTLQEKNFLEAELLRANLIEAKRECT